MGRGRGTSTRATVRGEKGTGPFAGTARRVLATDGRVLSPGGIGTVRWPRIVPKDPDCAESLKKRTLTNLYNQRPTWLAQAHQKLDEAVFAAYGWDPRHFGRGIARTAAAIEPGTIQRRSMISWRFFA